MRTILLSLALVAVAFTASAQVAKETTTTTTTAATGTTTNAAAAASGVEVGVSRRDGISYSDGAAYITRNGLMEKLIKELALPSGVKVAPDGNVTMPDGKTFRLKSNQTVSMAGVVQEIGSVPNIVIPVARPANAAVQGTSPAGNSAPARDTSQATVTGNTVNIPDRVGAGSQAK